MGISPLPIFSGQFRPVVGQDQRTAPPSDMNSTILLVAPRDREAKPVRVEEERCFNIRYGQDRRADQPVAAEFLNRRIIQNARVVP
jgi:hypothetical protein